MKFMVTDRLDQQLLQALQLDGRASFSGLAAVLGVSDQTVARRFRRLRAEGGMRVLGVRDEERLGQTRWFVRLRCTPDAAEPLATALARRPDTSWICLTSGGTEVMCTMRARDREERDALLFDKLQKTPRVVSVSAHSMLHYFYGGPTGWFSKFDALDPGQVAALTPPPPDPGGRPVVLDPVDELMLEVLGRDGRATLAELQAATHQSEPVMRRRLERLRSTGALYLDVQFDASHLGYDTTILWLTVAPAALATVGEALAGHREVAFASAVTGPSNIVAVALFREARGLYTYLSRRIGVLDGVQQVETAPVLRRIKQLSYLGPG